MKKIIYSCLLFLLLCSSVYPAEIVTINGTAIGSIVSINGTAKTSIHDINGNTITSCTAQTITWNTQPSALTYPATENLTNATASSSLTVTYSTDTTTYCTVSGSVGSQVLNSVNATGNCVVHANQAGNGTYCAASQVNSGNVAITALAPTVVEVAVAASADEALVSWSGSAWSLSSTSGEAVGYWSSANYKQGMGFRFLSVNIPANATITAAYIGILSDSSHTGTTVNSIITGELATSPATFSTIANYQGRRGTVVGGANNNNITSHQVSWNNIGSWASPTRYSSPDISSVIQEIVTAKGAITNLVLFWDDHDGNTSAVAQTTRSGWGYFIYGSTYAAKVHIEYTTP